MNSSDFKTWLRNRQREAHHASGALSGVAATRANQRFTPKAEDMNNTIEDRNRQSETSRASGQHSRRVDNSEQPIKPNLPPKTKCKSISFGSFEDCDFEDFLLEAHTSSDEKFSFEHQHIQRQVDPNTKCECNKSSTFRGSFEEFSSDLMSMLNDALSSDIVIKCGNNAIKAHKCILSARSPVFKAMFSTSMRESAEGTVSIDDIDPAIVRDMLTFIYSNQVQDLSVPKACDLLNAAEKYELQALKRICVDFLMRNLSVANAFLILQKADLYDEILKSHTLKFITKKFSDLKVTEEWKTVQSNNPSLALEVLNMIVEQFT